MSYLHVLDDVNFPPPGRWVPVTPAMLAGGGGGGGGGAGVDRELIVTTYVVKNAFSGASVGNTITCTQVIDVSAFSPSTIGTIWRNQTTGADLATAPSAADLTLVGDGAATEVTLQAIRNRLPATVGSAVAAQSLAVALSTEDRLVLDAVRDRLPAALGRTAMLNAVTTTQSGPAVSDNGRAPTFSANVSGTGAVSATIQVQARNTASGVWLTLGTITLSGTTSAADGFATLARYMEYRAVLSAISGTGAAVTVTMAS